MNCNSWHEMTKMTSPEEHQQRARITSQKFDEKTELNTQTFVAIPQCDASTSNAQNESKSGNHLIATFASCSVK